MTQPTAVLLHHFGGSARSWDGVVARLGGQVDTLALDLPGFGDAAGEPGPHTVTRYADTVADAIRAGGVGRYILVGHSMGGKVALALAARQSPGLVALLLLAPSPPTPEPIEEDERERLIAGWADAGSASETLRQITAEPLPGPVRKRTLDDMLRVSEPAWTAWLRYGSREDWSVTMAEITVPTTILSGTCDAVLPTDLLRRELVVRLPQARLTTVAGAGHLLPVEAANAVADAIAAACGPEPARTSPAFEPARSAQVAAI